MKTFKDYMSDTELAKKYKVPKEKVKEVLAKGKKVEREHTNDDKVADIIARHHAAERLDYYERLKKVD